MTHADAITTGRHMAEHRGFPVVVYRIRTWAPDVFGCIAASRELPPEAETFERFTPTFMPSQPATQSGEQGSLF
jgi:hypothetical protein